MTLLCSTIIEKFAYNSKLLTNAKANSRFWFLENKYYVGNIGYLNFDYIVISYQDIQYHLKKLSFAE